MASKPAFLTLKEAAGILRVSRSTIYKYARKKKNDNGFPVVRIEKGVYRIPRNQFIKWAGLNEGEC